MLNRVISGCLLTLCAACLPTIATAAKAQQTSPPVATVDAFHADLKAGNAKAALALLADNVFIAEQGFVDHGRSAYAKSQVQNDIAFAKVTAYKVLHQHVIWLDDNAACVISQARTTGTFGGHSLDLVGAETMLVRRFGDRWQIVHVHWSAHPAKSDGGGGGATK